MSVTLSPRAAELAATLVSGAFTINHFVGHLAYGDAVSSDAFDKWRMLRDLGIPGELFCGVPDTHYSTISKPICAHRPTPNELLVFHYSVWSETAEYLHDKTSAPMLLIYHNVTPSKWFQGWHPQAEADTRLGRERLGVFLDREIWAVGDSEYNRRELEAVGYVSTGVTPIMVNFSRFSHVPNPDIVREFRDGYSNFLSVGRIAPNKCHEDTIKAFYFYKRLINPRARLFIVGSTVVGEYRAWLERFARELGLDPHVIFPGHVSDADLAGYYACADVFVTMSEHEGFCVPILEAMAASVPVLGFDATAIPITMGDAGILLKRKRYDVAAETLSQMISHVQLRKNLIKRGHERLSDFSPEKTASALVTAVARALHIAQCT